jgi:hypothetical protein
LWRELRGNADFQAPGGKRLWAEEHDTNIVLRWSKGESLRKIETFKGRHV